MVTHVSFEEFQLIGHLLSSVLLESGLGSDFGVIDEGETGWLRLILLILDHICQFGLLTIFLAIVLFPLLDGGESRLVTFVEFTVNVRSVDGLILLAFLLKSCIHVINFILVSSAALLSQLRHRSRVRHESGGGVVRVRRPYRQKVIVIQDNASFLHDSE